MTFEPPKPAGSPDNRMKLLRELSTRKTAGGAQGKLDLHIEKQAEVGGLEMGVLNDGTPFLTGRALATLCGVHHKPIQELTAEWDSAKARVVVIKKILTERGFSLEKPYVASWQKGSAVFFAYPDYVCSAILE